MSNDVNNETSQVITKILKEFINELENFKKEIEFASSNLGGKADETGNILNQSLVNFQQSIARLASLFEKHTEANQNFEKKISILTLLPEKLSTRIKDMVPDIAEALDTKVMKNMEVIKAQFDSMNQEMALRVYEQQEKISQVTLRLIKESSLLTRNNRRGFLIGIIITIIFAIGTSALTSYLVTVKYPRFVKITGAHEVKVQDSDVKIWEQSKDSGRAEAKNK